MPTNKNGVCCCCDRETALTFHHLIPRKVHRRAHFKKHYSKEQLQSGIMVCRTCHSGIHKRFDEMSLAKELSSLTELKRNDELHRFFDWVAKQKIG